LRESVRKAELCGSILIEKIEILVDWLSSKHRRKFNLVATALALRQNCSSRNNHRMRYAVGIVVDAINARTRSNNTRDKT
jgi:hypothetical protein